MESVESAEMERETHMAIFAGLADKGMPLINRAAQVDWKSDYELGHLICIAIAGVAENHPTEQEVNGILEILEKLGHKDLETLRELCPFVREVMETLADEKLLSKAQWQKVIEWDEFRLREVLKARAEMKKYIEQETDPPQRYIIHAPPDYYTVVFDLIAELFDLVSTAVNRPTVYLARCEECGSPYVQDPRRANAQKFCSHLHNNRYFTRKSRKNQESVLTVNTHKGTIPST